MNLNRPTSFPLAAQAQLKRYRSTVYYSGGVGNEGGFFPVDCDAMSTEEADRIGIHHFLSKHRGGRKVVRVESQLITQQPEE